MLGALPEKPESTWRKHVPMLVHAYNYTGVMQLISVCIISCLAENYIYQLIYSFVQTQLNRKVTLVLNMVKILNGD